MSLSKEIIESHHPLAVLRASELHVKAHESPLPRHDQDRPGLFGLYCTLESNVGEVCLGKDVNHAPVRIDRIAVERDAELSSAK